MRVLFRLSIVILAVAVGVSSTGIPIVSPSPPAAVAEDPECPPNSEDDSSLSSGKRCIAEMVRWTRGYLNPVCFDDRALIENVVYAKNECYGGADNDWIEAIAHARAVMRLNAAGYAGHSASIGVTPNIQWEVKYPKRPGIERGGRIDILLYDRTPLAPR